MIKDAVPRALFLLLSFIICITVTSNYAYANKADEEKVLDFSIKTGSRSDELQWSIAGNSAGTSPNILSELTWDELYSWNVEGAVSLTLLNTLYIRSSLEYGAIYDGNNQDSDYAGDNRTSEFSRSNNNADGGSLLDAKAGVGYRFLLESANMAVIPIAGYAYHEQNLEITGGRQTIPATGPFPGLNSTYETEWKGPWVGLDLIFYGEKWGFESSLEYMFSGDYYGEANWNLRSDFKHPVSFTHDADATGISFSFDLDHQVTDMWAVELGLNYLRFETDEGSDKVFLANNTVSSTQLNEVTWDSFSFMLGLKLSF